MKNHKVLYLSLLVVLWLGLLPVKPAATGMVGQEQNAPIHLLSSNPTKVVFELATMEYTLEPVNTNDGVFQILKVPGYGLVGQVGSPQLPATSVLLGLPADAQVRVNVIDDQVVNLHGIDNLAPVPSVTPWDGQAELVQVSYIIDQARYLENKLIPVNPAQVEEYGWMRDLRFVRIGLYPFQYNPAQNVVVWRQRMTVEVFIENTKTNPEPVNVQGVDIQINSSFEKLMQAQLLNYDTAQAWRTSPPVDEVFSTTMEGERLRIGIDQDGLYRITYSDLFSAGMADVDPRSYRMTNQGQDVAIYVVGEEDGVLNEEDYILFYGEGFRGNEMAELYAGENLNWNSYTQQLPDGTTTVWKPQFTADMLEKYTTENVYWLQPVNGYTPTRMERVDGTPGTYELVQPTYRTTVHAEKQAGRWEWHFTSEDTWFWQFVADKNPRSYIASLSALSTETYTAVVRSEYVAGYNNDLLTPDHTVNFFLNSNTTPIAVSSWDGRSRHRFEVGVPSSALVEGDNQLGLTIVYDAVGPYVAFDWFEIDYERFYVAVAEEIYYPSQSIGSWRYQLNGFSQADVFLYDISNPHLPIRITNATSNLVTDKYQVEFQYTNLTSARFYAVSSSAIRTPKSIALYSPPDLRSATNGADYLIISHADLLDTAQGLAEYRENQGLRVRIIDVQDLYNEFNEGIRHPIAIKNFLRYTFSNWTPPAPKYVVLVGDGHWNLLGAYSGTAPILMPPNLGWVDNTLGEVDSSNLLGTIVGDDPLPDVLIGRIPVNSDLEFQNVIDKIIRYEQYPTAPWQLNNTFISDDTPDEDGDFLAMANYIISNYIEPGFNSIGIFLDDYKDAGLCGTPTYVGGPSCPPVNAKIVETFNGIGTLFATYIGHGAEQYWARELIFLYHLDNPTNPNDMYYSDFDFLTNDNQLPIILSMDCMDGYWIGPRTQPSLAELFIMTADHGAAATFSPTGYGSGLGHYSMMEGFFEAVYQYGIWELGTVALGAKMELYTDGVSRDMIHTYTVFGDPALSIPSPYGVDVSPEQASQQSLPGTVVSYTIQIQNTGVLEDTYQIVAAGNAFPASFSSNAVSIAPGEIIGITVDVEIPVGIPGGVTDTVTVRVLSDGDAAKQDSVTLQTIALAQIKLPFIRK